MFSKLRRKIVLINMLSVLIVLAAVFCVAMFSSYQKQKSQSILAMQIGMKQVDFQSYNATDGKVPENDPNGNRWLPDGQRPEMRPSVPTFTVILTADGTISAVYGDNIGISDERLEQIVTDILKTGSESGTVASPKLRYMTSSIEDNGVIVFADRQTEAAVLSNLALTFAAVGIGGLVFFFLLSLFLSSLALKPAKEAWERQQHFVADASHELKTPLTVILANTDIVLGHPDESVQSQKKWLESTRDEGERMKKLATDLLFLAKSDTKNHSPSMKEENYSDIVWSAALPFESVAYERRISLDCDISPNIKVRGNKAQLEQLTAILLDNACKYGESGGQVTLRLHASGGRAVLTVNNTGEPIDAKHLDKLFDRFYCVDEARSGSSGGCGLGLSIAKSIAEGHNARISVTSDSEHGTTFKVEIPSRA